MCIIHHHLGKDSCHTSQNGIRRPFTHLETVSSGVAIIVYNFVMLHLDWFGCSREKTWQIRELQKFINSVKQTRVIKIHAVLW